MREKIPASEEAGYTILNMTRLRRIEDRDRIFFVTTNVARGVSPLAAAERDLVLAAVRENRLQGHLLLFGYAIMPTHLHLLISPQEHDLIRVMRDLKSKTGFDIAHRRKIHGPVWQERYFDTMRSSA